MSAKRKIVKVQIELSPEVVSLLKVLDDNGSVENVLLTLADHAQQGVYRPGAWERMWLEQAFGYDWQNKLTPGDPYGRPHCDHIFMKAKEL